MKKELVKEIARDIIALGSIPFFILVLARIWILHDPVYFYKFLFSGILFLIPCLLLKSDIYSGLALISVIFLSLNYKDTVFTFFACLAYILLLASLVYLKKEKQSIIKGIMLGAASSLIVLNVVR